MESNVKSLFLFSLYICVINNI